ncbi:dodecenoyl-Coenzyme A delta isomerase [Salpingoeca rosetta]|uniref:Enoyl-CoA delta isomerase 1, mitochondrial n=1 Tax=Salpingoeca rosetta (strain ATCC 50818 / BSB-021) TaxID=946362 RepID=F2UL70_SALR5|nr:dodecenoyl-Coenzyme A delta isomerase [Salpingoeca rosetta]EGD77869.1 dodecenoyl-Coenzyme A delta isomerase [Salpingoeca rosetta]|eukprot:XP_004989933.1 dodecenoyl-Coenzyme A delta isomerase [Salpingoeca rosetta]
MRGAAAAAGMQRAAAAAATVAGTGAGGARARLLQATRAVSAISVEPTDVDGVKILYMNHKPVNALSLEFTRDLVNTIEELEADKDNKAVVIASSLPSTFMAGLDIREMYDKDLPHLNKFWSTLQDLFLKLMTTRLATAAAVEGNSPAGGCLVALMCDERVMADAPVTIGLNETKLGIVAPVWFMDLFRGAVGQRNAERLLQLGALLSPHEAKGVGLVDYVRPREDVVQTCVDLLQDYLAVPAAARHLSKLAIRKDIVDKVALNREGDLEFFVKFIRQPAVQKGLGKYLEALAQRQANKTKQT